MITPGDIIGHVNENELFTDHKIMFDPNFSGRIVETFDEGNYTVADTVCVLEDMKSGKHVNVKMAHFWPVRQPRPVAEKI